MKRHRIIIIGIWVNRLVVYPHPRQLMRSEYSPEDREAVADYIEKCSIQSFASTFPGLDEDCLLNNNKEFEFDLRTDGRWLFPLSLAYYVRQGVSLPSEFVQHVRKTKTPPVFERVSQNNCAIDEFFWIFWSLTHSLWNSYFVWFLIRLVINFPLYLLFYFCRRIFRYHIW